MQCLLTLEMDCYSGNKMKTFNNYKILNRKESNIDTIVDQLCTRLQDIEDQESASCIGMPTCTIEQTEAIRRYCAAFPALKKGQESLQYYLPPPAWCRKSAQDTNFKMQSELSMSNDWNLKNKKFSGRERRNSYNGQRKHNRKRCTSYNRSFDNKESLPEWVTHEGVWDMETQDPVKEFIRAIALDEGYGTCENTVIDEIKEITQVKIRMQGNMMSDWDDSLDFESSDWFITEDSNPRVRTPTEQELYAKFEAKFDRSIEALWSKDTPDDEYQDLPIDFHDLLSSPSDHMFADPSTEKCSLISLTESIWSNDGFPAIERADSPSKIVDVLQDHFKPLNLADTAEPEYPPREIESFSLYEGDEIYDALSTVAITMHSFTAINHSRDRSGFVEVLPRRNRGAHAAVGTAARPRPAEEAPRPPSREGEDLLTSARTHFRPIRREKETEVAAARYADGDTFDIRGDLDPVEFRRSESGGVYLESSLERYLEYRASKGIDYGRLNLTEAQRCPDLEDPAFRLRFPLRQLDMAAQTERAPAAAWGACEECGRAAKKMRPSGMDSIWSEGGGCGACAAGPGGAGGGGGGAAEAARDEQAGEWEELLSDIGAAHAEYARGDALDETLVSAERKRRHSAALRGPADGAGAGAATPSPRAGCTHPHARFLHCCALAMDRPLTR